MKKIISRIFIIVLIVVFVMFNASLNVNATSTNTSYSKAEDLGVFADNDSTSVTGSISMSGVDLYYKITVEEAGELSILFNHPIYDSTSSLWQVGIYLEDGVTFYTGPSSLTVYYKSYANVADTNFDGIFLDKGTYYVVVTNGNKFTTDSFNMTLSYTHNTYCETENNSSLALADELLPNINYSGCISSTVDSDYYKIVLPEDGYIDITLTTTLQNSSESYYQVRLLQEDGVTEYMGPSADGGVIDYWNFKGNSTVNTIEALGLKAGTYYLMIQDANKCNTDKYNLIYNYVMTEFSENESNESFLLANELKVNKDYVGATYHSADVDWYKFTTTEDGYFNISLTHDLNNSTDTYYVVYIYGQDGKSYITGDTHYWYVKGTNNLEMGNIGIAAGTYYIEVKPSSIKNTHYTIRVNFTESDSWEKEGNSTYQTATNVGGLREFHGATQYSPTNGNDVDWFKININYPETYKLTFNHSMSGSASNAWNVKLYSSNGTTVLKTGYVKGNEVLEMDLGNLSKGIYYLRISNATNSSPDNYSAILSDEHTHSYGSATSFLEDGHRKTCSICLLSFEFQHEWNDGKVLTEPTHLKEGLKEVTCKECSYKTTLVIPKLTEHNYIKCEKYNSNQHELTCECGHIKYESHEWDEGEVILENTCTTDGKMLHKCLTCLEEKTEVIPLAHGEIIEVPSALSTCTEPGHKKYSYCSICNEEIIKKVELELASHTKSDWITTVQPGCIEFGEKHIECTVCHEILQTASIQPKGHVSSSYKIDVHPTCTENGERYKVCIVCDIELSREMMEPLEHVYVKSIVEPTCTTEGYTAHTCVTCNDTYYDEIVSMLGHEGGYATCVSKAKCDRCKEFYGDIDLRNHDYSIINSNETHHWRECVCGEKQELIEHEYMITIVQEATEYETGLIDHTCIHCDHAFGEIIPVLEPVKESGCSSNFSIIFISLLTAMPIVLFRRKRFL